MFARYLVIKTPCAERNLYSATRVGTVGSSSVWSSLDAIEGTEQCEQTGERISGNERRTFVFANIDIERARARGLPFCTPHEKGGEVNRWCFFVFFSATSTCVIIKPIRGKCGYGI